MNPILTQCPVCAQPLIATRLYCSHCDTSLEGSFNPGNGPFARLTPEQMQFMLTFVRCEGRFNRMEDELGLSYPTLRNRLYEVIRALGYEPGKEDPATRIAPEERKQLLEDLDQGKITYEQAMRALQSPEA